MSAEIAAENTSSATTATQNHHYKVVALVPACNEEESIEKSLRSLLSQTYRFEYILVIANNCKDNTVAVVKSLQAEFGKSYLRLEEMAVNKHKKSGALNYGYAMLEPDVDF